MKCEKCERDLIGDSVLCECGHDSSLRRATESANETPRQTAITTFGSSAATSASLSSEANLIRFPKSAPPVVSQADNDLDVVPVWRNEVRERVRQFREQRPEPTFVERAIDPEVALSQNPIVEAALKRLHKAPESFPEGERGFGSGTAASMAPERYSSHQSSSAPAYKRETASLPRPVPSASEERSGAHGAVLRSPANPVASAVTTPTATKSAASSSASELRPAPTLQALNPPMPATLWDRTLAGSMDFVLIAVACIPLYSIHSITGLRFGQNAAYAAIGIAVWLTFLYQTWTMLLAGRTCGMAWRHLRVVDPDNCDPVFPQWKLFVRSICGTISLLLPPLNVVIIWATGNQTGLADLLSKTTVVQTHAPQVPGLSAPRP